MSFVAILFLAGFLLIIGFSISVFLGYNNRKYILSLLEIVVLLFSIFFFLTAFLLYDSIQVLEKLGTDNYDKAGPYGDYIGGMLNPLIAIFAVVAAGFAFYAQYQANKQVQDQFKIQQFESQFYEMVHLHRENLNEMIIEGYEYDYLHDDKSKVGIEKSKKKKVTSGKKIFVTMLNEFEAIHLICKKQFFIHYKSDSEKMVRLESFIGNQLIFDHSYYVFFNGINFYSKNIEQYISKDKTGLLNKALLEKYIIELKRIKENHLKGIKEVKQYTLIRGLPLKSQTLWLSFNYKPFSGHQSILAHYYRHLFQIVKFVVKQPDTLITYQSKRDYLRILRSMFSNHEQILLYYNWIAGFGTKWEKKRENIHINTIYNNSDNRFFTDFRMIHNIPNQMIINEFKLEKIFIDDYLNFKYESGRKKSDALFELVPIKSKLK